MYPTPMDIFADTWETLPEAPQAPSNTTPVVLYPPTLPHDIALAQDEEEINDLLARHSLTSQEYEYIADLPTFRQEVSEWKQKIITEGYSFKLKLRGIAEAYIPQVITLLHDPTVAPSVRTDLFKYVVKCAELEPKKDAQTDTGNKITIEINSFGAPSTPAIDITPNHSLIP